MRPWALEWNAFGVQKYQRLFAEVRAGPAVTVDETSWWVGGPGQWLWTFATETVTLYQVRDARNSAVVIDVLTPEYAGVVLVSDHPHRLELELGRVRHSLAWHQWPP